MQLRRLLASAAVATITAAGLVAAGTPAAAQGGCAGVPGVGKRIQSNGVTEFYEDTRCGQLQPANRPQLPHRVPRPTPTTTPTDEQINDPAYRRTHNPSGGACLCGGVIGIAIWSSMPPIRTGTVKVGEVTVVE
jgi:hypothetical protein